MDVPKNKLKKQLGHSLMVRRNFLQKEERRSRARLSWPLLSVSSKRRSEGSERTATSPTGRRATVARPSETPRLSKHTGPAEHSSLEGNRTRARVVTDCQSSALRDNTAPPRASRPSNHKQTTYCANSNFAKQTITRYYRIIVQKIDLQYSERCLQCSFTLNNKFYFDNFSFDISKILVCR